MLRTDRDATEEEAGAGTGVEGATGGGGAVEATVEKRESNGFDGKGDGAIEETVGETEKCWEEGTDEEGN